MPVQLKADFHNLFVVQTVGALDIASHGAVGSVDTIVTVTSLDGADAAPLRTTDWVVQVLLPANVLAGIAVQTAFVTSTNQITLRTTNASAASVDPPSVAAGGYKFIIGRP